MKRKILTFIIALAALCGSSVATAQFRWGATVGGNFNKFKFKQADILTVDQGFGESAGINGEMMFPGIGFGIDLGLRYEQLGGTLNLGDFHPGRRRAIRKTSASISTIYRYRLT